MTFRKYAHMTDSGVQIIGKIPESWSILKGKYFLKIYGGGELISPIDENDKENFFKVEDLNHANDDMTLEHSESHVSKSGKIIKGPVILIPKRGEAIHTNKVVITHHNCSFDSNIMGLSTKKFDLRYVSYFLLSRKLSDIADTTTIPQINNKHIKPLEFPNPSLQEQKEISYFLDNKSKIILKEILKNEKLIELLKEQRQSAINRVVTKGLNDTVPMKDSGIDWIGKIPKHWNVKCLKYVSKFELSTVDRHEYTEEIQVSICHYPQVYNNDTISENIELSNGTCTKKEFDAFRLKKDDVLITKDSETPSEIGVPAYVNYDFKNVVCGYHLAHLTTKKNMLLGNFLFRYLQSNFVNAYFETEANGVTRFGLGKYSINNLKIPLPPNIEQKQIANYLDEKTTKTDLLISKVTSQIQKLKEFRESLISSAVSGKICVTN